MGSSGDEALDKPEKPSSPAPEQANVHVYPDWAAYQAYYGAGVTLPPPYFNSSVPGHPPHPYMWGPQPMMPPYGTPYAAMYAHGGVYHHPSVSVGSHAHGGPSSPAVAVASPLSIAAPCKSTSNKEDGLLKKKMKGPDGLAGSTGTGNEGNAAGTHSEEDGTEASSNGSDGNTEAGDGQVQRKGSRDGTPPRGKEGKVNPQEASNKSLGISGAPFETGGKQLETVFPLRMAPALEMMASSTGKRKTTVPPAPAAALPAHDGLPSEPRMKDERVIKREKRKQSNRESARRSRLRKQVESEELALKVDSLNVENLALRSEINRLTENSKKLRIENTALMEKVKNAQLEQSGVTLSSKTDEQSSATICTENFLSRVHNSDVTKNQHLESGAHENPNSGTKLHQLLKSSPRADAVVAG
ncbi:hypothetical protein IFM89_020066 [Coptis chinensis]|uniref:BZIP domain-containing protein n=1 Tax=Coptis chinensis TaxID=261450 RepID=A0A835H6M6_9MAGN|nr:hypothetical protein IFM89_020066 [Coptis chinensis]